MEGFLREREYRGRAAIVPFGVAAERNTRKRNPEQISD